MICKLFNRGRFVRSLRFEEIAEDDLGRKLRIS
jgi:hypothetical protein